MKVVMLILMFFIISGLFIVSNNNLHLNKQDEFAKFSSAYYIWMGKLFNNLVVTTGQVVGLDWLPDKNSTLTPK